MKKSLWTSLKSTSKKLAIILGLSTLLVVVLDRFILSLDWVLEPASLKGAQEQNANWKFCKAGMFQSLEDPLRHFGLSPSMDLTIDDCRYQHNDRGLRDSEVTVPKPPGEHRILMIGDSYTYGWGVDQKDTIPAQLQNQLHQHPKLGNVRVINCGVPAYDTAAEFAFLDRAGLTLEPDAIILVFQVNDVTKVDHFYLDDFMGFYACDLPLPHSWKRGLDHSPIYHLVRKAHVATKTALGFGWFGEKEWPRTEEYLRRFIKRCQEVGLPLVIVNLPHFQIGSSDKFLTSYRDEHPEFSIQNDWVYETAKSLNTPTVEILPVMQKRVTVDRKPVEALYVSLAELDDPPEDENGNPRYKSRADHHLNAEGCRIVAEEISTFIFDSKWLPGL